MKKIIALILVVMSVCSVFSINTSALEWSYDGGIKTYVLSTQNDTVVYNNEYSMSGKKGVVDSQELITIIARNGDRFKVKYSSGIGYIDVCDVIMSAGAEEAERAIVADSIITVYRRYNQNERLGSISANDIVYILDEEAVEGRIQVIYPITGGYKMGWIYKYELITEPVPIAYEWRYPLNDVKITQVYCGRNGHLGIDAVSYTDKTLYAAATGKVVAVGKNFGKDGNTRKGNGYYVVIEHNFNGKTLYSMYGHMQADSAKVVKGQIVEKGTPIGIMGNTGDSTGPHVHFAIADTMKYGSYYGYTKDYTNFHSDVKTESRSGVTFYNPVYIIENGKLPC